VKSQRAKSQKSTGKTKSRAKKVVRGRRAVTSTVRRTKRTAKKARKKATESKAPARPSGRATRRGQAKKPRAVVKTGRRTTAGTAKSRGSTTTPSPTTTEKYGQAGAPWWKAYL
jgi:hypothetical protein